MKKILCLTIVLSAITHIVLADCSFIVNNYSDKSTTVELGFMDKAKDILSIPAASANTIELKSDLNCKSTSLAGLGIAYIKLVGSKSKGSWIYNATSNTIRAVGAPYGSTGAIDEVHGTKILLLNNLRPSDSKFEVAIEKAGRNISNQVSSMD